MHWVRIILVLTFGAMLLGILAWLGREPIALSKTGTTHPVTGITQPGLAIKLGLIPERDIFAQRARHRALADYLQDKLGRPVELVTAASYEDALEDLREARVDASFFGSLVAVLAVDRCNAQILVKTRNSSGVDTYRGVIVVPEDSPVRAVGDLTGRSIAMVKATTAGDLFPMSELYRQGLLDGSRSPRLLWVGTHDDVLFEVTAGRADAGALKDLRLDDLLKANAGLRVRRLATSPAVPDGTLAVRADLAGDLGPRLRDVLLNMDSDAHGRTVLAQYGASEFVPCEIAEFIPVLDMVEQLGPAWNQIGVGGPAPRKAAVVGQ